jgi:hypothetical protein
MGDCEGNVTDQDESMRVETSNLKMLETAAWWVRFLYPVDFDRVFHISGLRVRVSVSRYVSPDDTQPIRTAQDRVEE